MCLLLKSVRQMWVIFACMQGQLLQITLTKRSRSTIYHSIRQSHFI